MLMKSVAFAAAVASVTFACTIQPSEVVVRVADADEDAGAQAVEEQKQPEISAIGASPDAVDSGTTVVPDAGAITEHDAGQVLHDAAPPIDSAVPPIDSGPAPIAASCGILPSENPIYTETCTIVRQFSDPNVAFIEWVEVHGSIGPFVECGFTCIHGSRCRVHYKNGTYNSGVCQ